MIPAALLLTLAATAFAQEAPALDAQIFHASVDGRAGLSLDDGIVAPDRQFTGRALLQYVNDPLVFVADDGTETAALSDILVLDLLPSYTAGRFRIGADVPVYLGTWGEAIEGGALMGDLALDVRVALLDSANSGLGLAPDVRITLPSAGGAAPVGSGGFDGQFGAAISKSFGDWLVAANLGVHVLPTVELDNVSWGSQLAFRAGLSRAVGEKAGLSGELGINAGFDDFLANSAGSPSEGMVAGWFRPKENVVVRLGLGTGLSRGIGAPDARVILGVGYEPSLARDKDKDGILDNLDECPDEAEDMDGFEDGDGCPDPDNDRDGIPDAQDACPQEREDLDGWHDDDGCPDLDTTVNVTVKDPGGNRLKTAHVVLGGWQNDGDFGTVDLPEGTYALKLSAPGFLDLVTTVTVKNGPPMEVIEVLEYVPPPEPSKEQRVVITREKITFYDKIYFDTGKTTIKKQSFSLLDEIAGVLKEHPELLVVRVEGHTDSRGDSAKNLKLSQGRAEAVKKYLVKAGVADERLAAEGFGAGRPVERAENEAAWEKNRRVEFVIEKRAE